MIDDLLLGEIRISASMRPVHYSNSPSFLLLPTTTPALTWPLRTPLHLSQLSAVLVPHVAALGPHGSDGCPSATVPLGEGIERKGKGVREEERREKERKREREEGKINYLDEPREMENWGDFVFSIEDGGKETFWGMREMTRADLDLKEIERCIGICFLLFTNFYFS